MGQQEETETRRAALRQVAGGGGEAVLVTPPQSPSVSVQVVAVREKKVFQIIGMVYVDFKTQKGRRSWPP